MNFNHALCIMNHINSIFFLHKYPKQFYCFGVVPFGNI